MAKEEIEKTIPYSEFKIMKFNKECENEYAEMLNGSMVGIIKNAVHNACVKLDNNIPYWYNEIDLDKFNISWWYACVRGQLGWNTTNFLN